MRKKCSIRKQLLNIVQNVFNWKEKKKDNEKKQFLKFKEFPVVLIKSFK